MQKMTEKEAEQIISDPKYLGAKSQQDQFLFMRAQGFLEGIRSEKEKIKILIEKLEYIAQGNSHDDGDVSGEGCSCPEKAIEEALKAYQEEK